MGRNDERRLVDVVAPHDRDLEVDHRQAHRGTGRRVTGRDGDGDGTGEQLEGHDGDLQRSGPGVVQQGEVQHPAGGGGGNRLAVERFDHGAAPGAVVDHLVGPAQPATFVESHEGGAGGADDGGVVQGIHVQVDGDTQVTEDGPGPGPALRLEADDPLDEGLPSQCGPVEPLPGQLPFRVPLAAQVARHGRHPPFDRATRGLGPPGHGVGRDRAARWPGRSGPVTRMGPVSRRKGAATSGPPRQIWTTMGWSRTTLPSAGMVMSDNPSAACSDAPATPSGPPPWPGRRRAGPGRRPH